MILNDNVYFLGLRTWEFSSLDQSGERARGRCFFYFYVGQCLTQLYWRTADISPQHLTFSAMAVHMSLLHNVYYQTAISINISDGSKQF